MHVYICIVCALPRPAFIRPNEKVVDNEEQATPWKNEKEMQGALNFRYSVFLENNETMPEIPLNTNGPVGLSRRIRKSSGDPAPTLPRI